MEGKRVEGKRAVNQPGGKKAWIVVLTILGLLVGAYLGLCAWVQNNGQVMPNVRFATSAVFGKTRSEVEASLTEQLKPESIPYHINIQGDQYEESLGMDVAAIDVSANVDRVMSAGKEDFLLSGFYYLRGCFSESLLQVEVVPESITITEEGMAQIQALLDRVDESMDVHANEEGYTVDLEAATLTMTKGYTQRRVDRTDALDQIREALVRTVDRPTRVVLVVEEQPPVQPDCGAIHDELYAEAAEPVYHKETGEVSEHIIGVDLDEAALLAAYESAAEGETFSVPLTVTRPKDTKESYEAKLFADVLGVGDSKVSGTANRKTNVKLSAAACDGIILLPGEEFSYNNTTGSRSADKGYLPAPTYNAGASVDDVGGGICQTSSTIYYAVLHTTLEIVERHNHSYATGYVPDGMDATVFYGSLDFRFKNNTNYPLKIVTESYDKNGVRRLKVTLYGTNEDGRYAKPTNAVFEVVEPTKSYLADETVARGTLVLDEKQNAYRGRKAQVTRTIYEADGTVVEKEDLGVSRYKMRPHLYRYNPLDGDPATWPNGVPPKPVVEPVVPEVPAPEVVPPEVTAPETPAPGAAVPPEAVIPTTINPEVPTPETAPV